MAQHQSGHNSGVIHAGIYYEPGTLMAKLCVQGIDLMYDFLDEKKIPYAKCGKLIVAVDETEVPHLERLYERAQRNACREIKLVDGDTIHKMQPSCRGIKALHSPHTGIVDFAEVTRALASDYELKGGNVLLEHQLTAIQPSKDAKHCIQLKFSGDKFVDAQALRRYLPVLLTRQYIIALR